MALLRMLQMTERLFKFIGRITGLIVCFILLCAVIISTLVLEREPRVIPPAPSTPQDYANIAGFAQGYVKQAQTHQRKNLNLVVDKALRDSVERLVPEQIRNSYVSVQFEKDRATLAASSRLPYGFWLNIRTQQNNGAAISPVHTYLGKLPLPKRIVESLMNIVIQYQTGLSLAEINSSVKDIQVTTDEIKFIFAKTGLEKLSVTQLYDTYAKLNGQQGLMREDRVNFYRSQFLTIARDQSSKNTNHSVAIYLASIDYIQQSHQINESEVSYALIALASLTAAPHFNNLFPFEDKGKHINFTLANRSDLAKHFLLSAAIHVLTTQNTSFSVGQAKELLDSKKGGSGFSFIDLAADRAGILFAEKAIEFEQLIRETPRYKKPQIAKESDFFPDVNDLQEGLSEMHFQRQYHSLESKEYQNTLDLIDARIAALDFYSFN